MANRTSLTPDLQPYTVFPRGCEGIWGEPEFLKYKNSTLMYHGINYSHFWHVLHCITLPLMFGNYANVLIFFPIWWSSHLTQSSLYSPFSASNFLILWCIYGIFPIYFFPRLGLFYYITLSSLCSCICSVPFLHEEKWFIKLSKNYCEIFAYNYQLFHNNSTQLTVLP